MNEEKKAKRTLLRALAVVAAIGCVVALSVLAACRKKPVDPVDTDVDEGVVYLSPSSVAVGDDGSIYVSDATANKVTKIGTDGKVKAEYQTEGSANRVIFKDGKVYLLEGGLAGNFVRLSADLKKEASVEVGHTPADAVIDGGKAYVVCRFTGDLYKIDLSSMKTESTTEVGREPICMAKAGNELYIGCYLPENASNETVVSSDVAVYSLDADKITATIPLVNGAQSLRGICATADGKTVYAAHLISRYTYPTTQLDRGWINTNGFSIIDTASKSATAILLDEVERGAANPYDVALDKDEANLYFSLSGSQEIMKVYLAKLSERMEKVAEGKFADAPTLDKIVDCTTFLSGIQSRLKLSGNGVRDIEISGDTLFASQYFTGNVAKVDLTAFAEVAAYESAPQVEATSARIGEELWYNSDYCYQGWESCASCHPDGRADGLNWDNLNDGLGNPKNTKSMLYAHRTPPAMVTAARADAETAVRKGMSFIQFNTLDEEHLCAIDDYLRSMLPEESPYLNRDGTLSEAALRGKELFSEKGCAECHPAPLYTDLSTHKSNYIGSDGTWEDRDLDTPTLVEIWRTAPYNYCGGIADIKTIVRDSAKGLTDAEVDDITEYILSLGTVDEFYGVVEVFSQKDGNSAVCSLEAGATIDKITLIRQKKKASEATLTLKFVRADGKAASEKTYSPGKLKYGQVTELAIGEKVPADFAKGDYVEITFTDKSCASLASPYRLYIK